MARLCTVCTHGERAAIDTALAAGTSYRDIARHYGVSKDAAARHASDHIAQTIAAAQSARDAVAEGAALDVVTQLKAINSAALAILRDARASRDHELALKAIDRLQKQIELQAKLLGDLDERARVEVSIVTSQQWVDLRGVILAALLPYPDARAAVAGALTIGRTGTASPPSSATAKRGA